MSYVASVQRAIDYIEAHLGEEIDLASLAAESYISVAHLYRVFYALTGHPIKDYVRKRRMSVAADHLRNSKRSVEELAWESGFESYHSFAKVFKKIVGLTPAVYRNADIYFSFEPIRLYEQVAYREDKEQAERFPDVKVIRFMPGKVYAYLHTSNHEMGIEKEAFHAISELLLAASGPRQPPKMRIFGYNIDLPTEGCGAGHGYRMLIVSEEELITNGQLTQESFTGGLYAVRKIAAKSPETIQEGWDRLLSEWLPKSTFEIGAHQYIEEFIAYNGTITRMNLYLPVQRKLRNEPIEMIERQAVNAFFYREYGVEAQQMAEQRLIDWYEKRFDGNRGADAGSYYMSYCYGEQDTEAYWWENGLLIANEAEVETMKGLEWKCMASGLYACCVSRAYGLLTGVLDQMHRWIAKNDEYRLDEERQWFAEYRVEGPDIERDAVVKIYLPILQKGVANKDE